MIRTKNHKHCTPQDLQKTLVGASIVPHLDYCYVLYLDLPFFLRIQLQRPSHRAVRYIFNLRMSTRVTPFRRQLGWLQTDSRLGTCAPKRAWILREIFYPIRVKQTDATRGLRIDLGIPHVGDVWNGTYFFSGIKCTFMELAPCHALRLTITLVI